MELDDQHCPGLSIDFVAKKEKKFLIEYGDEWEDCLAET
jgi:hypothetical protein